MEIIISILLFYFHPTNIANIYTHKKLDTFYEISTISRRSEGCYYLSLKQRHLHCHQNVDNVGVGRHQQKTHIYQIN